MSTNSITPTQMQGPVTTPYGTDGNVLNATDENQQSVVINPNYYNTYTFFANDTKANKASEERLNTDASAYTIDPRTGDGTKFGDSVKYPDKLKHAIDQNIQTITGSATERFMQNQLIGKINWLNGYTPIRSPLGLLVMGPNCEMYDINQYLQMQPQEIQGVKEYQ